MGRERMTLVGHENLVLACAITPDGAWIVSGSVDNTVRIWNTAKGREHTVLVGHEGYVTGCAISPHGLWCVSSSWDETLRVWKMPVR